MGEDQQQEEQPVIRSINNDHRSFVRFINKTPHNVKLYWIDYQGQAISYGVLSSGGYVDIDTFATHPWIFVDEETRDRKEGIPLPEARRMNVFRYMVNQRDVFFPEPWFGKYRGLRRSNLPQRYYRTYVYITLPIYTLRELSLRAVRRCLQHERQAFLLDIPRTLQQELSTMLPRKEDDDRDNNKDHDRDS